jgi:hypothetical protein
MDFVSALAIDFFSFFIQECRAVGDDELLRSAQPAEQKQRRRAPSPVSAACRENAARKRPAEFDSAQRVKTVSTKSSSFMGRRLDIAHCG